MEHDEAIMRSADQLIDIGPYAGVHGGQLIFQGHYKDILAFVVLLLVLVFRPSGLMGERVAERA